MSGCQLKELEDMLSDVYTTSQFVDTALDSGTDTQLILVKKQVHEKHNPPFSVGLKGKCHELFCFRFFS
jgi:hypothetical protein